MVSATATGPQTPGPFDRRRWRRDALIVVGLTIVGFGSGALWFLNNETLEAGSLVAWSVLCLAVLVWAAAFLWGGSGGLAGMTFLALLLLSLAIGYGVQGTTGSEGGLAGAVFLIIFGVMVVPVTAVWSLVDLFRPPRLRRWQQRRYSLDQR